MPRKLLISLLSALLLLGINLSALAETSQPNIIVILADDLGYADLSSFGATDIATPRIDRMAEDGLKFSSFYSGASVCSPSRAGFLTGRLASRMGMDHVFMHDSVDGMPLSEITIAEQLKQAGYTTGLVGKWHLGHLDRYMPWNQGFDEFYGVPYSNDMPNFFYYENKTIDYTEIDQRYLTQRYTETALDFIRRSAESPFFLFISHSMPHVPVYVSPEFEGKSNAGTYGDAVQEIDWSTGEIIDLLSHLGISENTIVIFTSDNGPWRAMGSDGGSAGIYRDGKSSAFEGGQRVPMVMHWPNGIKMPREVTEVASLLDLMPTFSSITGVPLPEGLQIDGRDITHIIRASDSATSNDFFYQGFFSHDIAAYRKGDWKLKLPRSGYPGFLNPILKLDSYAHGEMLFNLAEDPGENTNVASEFPQQVEALRHAITEKQAELDADKPRNLYMHPLSADRKGYLPLVAKAGFLALVALAAVVVALRWLYRIGRRKIRGLGN